jgi:chromosome partitioning protein
MEIWALANQKGGTGKTTTAINLAASLAALGKRVCLVDLDPQAHATLGLSCHVEEEGSIARTFLDGAPLSTLVRTVPSGFHLVPSTLGLAEFEQVAERTLAPERILGRALRELDGRHDWVLLDCPPRADGVLCANAVRAATTTLLVVETGAFAMQGALQARRLFEALASDRSRALDLRYLATRFDRGAALSRELLVAMQARFGREMLDSVIRRDSALRDAAAYGVPVRKLDPASRGALDHDALAREVLQLPRAALAPRAHAPSETRKSVHLARSDAGVLVPHFLSARSPGLPVD